MTQYRKGLFRNGNHWCSASELERLRREAAEGGLEDRKRLRRAERRCGVQQGKAPTILRLKSAKRPAKIFNEPANKEEQLDLIVRAIERSSTGGHTWKISAVVDLFFNPPITLWRVRVFGDPEDHEDDIRAVTSDLKTLFPRNTLVLPWSAPGPLGGSIVYVDPEQDRRKSKPGGRP